MMFSRNLADLDQKASRKEFARRGAKVLRGKFLVAPLHAIKR